MKPTLSYIILSIKPHFAHLILNGQKTIELRKFFSVNAVGKMLFLYATTPRKAILGTVMIDKVHSLPLAELKKRFIIQSCISADEFDKYYEKWDKGIAISLKNPVTAKKPLTLSELRLLNFKPPNSHLLVNETHSLKKTLSDFTNS